MREGLSVSVCRHWHQTLCKLLQSETLRWWALQRGTYYWAERKWTFSLSQMGKASLLVFCHGEKRCMKWPFLFQDWHEAHWHSKEELPPIHRGAVVHPVKVGSINYNSLRNYCILPKSKSWVSLLGTHARKYSNKFEFHSLIRTFVVFYSLFGIFLCKFWLRLPPPHSG